MKEKLKNILTSNWQVKIMALVIGAAIWYYAGSRLKEEVILREVPVRIEIPDDYRLLYQSHRSVQLRLVGPQYLVQRRQEEAGQNYLQFRVRLTEEDLAGEQARLEIAPSWLNVSESELVMMNLVAVEPEEIVLFASRVERRSVPVEVVFSGRPSGGYEITGHTVTPSEVSVEGPSAVLERMDSIKTLSIPVWDAQESFRRYMLLNTTYDFEMDGGVGISVPLSASPSQVAVHVSVGAEHKEREIDAVPVRILKPIGFLYQADIPPEDSAVRVVLSGLPDAVENVGRDDITAYLDLSDLAEETVPTGTTAPYKQPVEVILRPGSEARIARVVPEEITVLLTNQ